MPRKNSHSPDVLGTIRSIRRDLAERFTVRRIGVFGSFATGNAAPESDVDIPVDLDEPTFDHYMDLKFHPEDILKRPVDPVLTETIRPRLKPIIDREMIYAWGCVTE
ncbi:MAG TPA: nucleotidyltransferase family protein [bacterium]|nr:nucleotidyltransferase family protein [bacterium]HQL63905.1 nucleotidyltransferase family protein [bacterium]